MSDPIKLTNREVLESNAALATLSQVKLPAKAAYAVAKALGKLGDLEKTIRGVQKTLWEKFGEKGEDGKLKLAADSTFVIPAAQSADFLKEHNELLAEVNEISSLRQVTLTELGSASLEPATLLPLDWFVKDE
jgi:hypothetical protein